MDWTNDQKQFLLSSLHMGIKDIYLEYRKRFGDRSYDSVQKKVKRLQEAMEILDSEEHMEEEVENILEEIPFVQGIPPETKLQIKEATLEWLAGLSEFANKYKYTVPQLEEIKGISLCVMISDLHIGQHNKNFDLEIARERINEFPVLVKEMVGVYDINEVILLFMGDIIEGEDIYPTQATHIECPVITQLEIATESLWKMILKFKELFQCRVVIETVPGNHGRVSKTANEKTNWDNVLYYTLQQLAASYQKKDIIFHLNYDEFNKITVQGKTGLIVHKGTQHAGTPAMRDKIGGWIYRKSLDFICAGHWHDCKEESWQGCPVYSNGCLCGNNELSERISRETDAKQGFFLVTKTKAPFGFSKIIWQTPEED